MGCYKSQGGGESITTHARGNLRPSSLEFLWPSPFPHIGLAGGFRMTHGPSRDDCNDARSKLSAAEHVGQGRPRPLLWPPMRPFIAAPPLISAPFLANPRRGCQSFSRGLPRWKRSWAKVKTL